MSTLVVFVINARFVSDADDIPYGAAGYVRSLSRGLRQRGHETSIIGYRRDDSHPVGFASVRHGYRLGHRYIELIMNSECPAARMRTAFDDAITRLHSAHRAVEEVVLYHQSSFTLPFTPQGVTCVVTHHAPFVDEVRRTVGSWHCIDAFAGGEAKVDALERFQQRGVAWLREHPTARALELSTLQAGHLVERGVGVDRCAVLPPPLADDGSGHAEPPQRLPAWARRAAGRILLVTAAARADGFKNLDAVVRAYRELETQGHRSALYIACGGPQDTGQRRQLWKQVPAPLRHHCVLDRRQRHAQIVAAFRLLAGKAVFVFPSRYETLGLTPLEAMRQGLAVVVPGPPTPIGMREHTPSSSWYTPSDGAAGIADVVRRQALSVEASATAAGSVREYTVDSCVTRFEELALIRVGSA